MNKSIPLPVERAAEGALEVSCPACGALIEANGMDELIVRARAHTQDAHNYDIPDSHVVQAAVRI